MKSQSNEAFPRQVMAYLVKQSCIGMADPGLIPIVNGVEEKDGYLFVQHPYYTYYKFGYQAFRTEEEATAAAERLLRERLDQLGGEMARLTAIKFHAKREAT